MKIQEDNATNMTNDLINLSHYSEWCQEDFMGEEQQSHMLAFALEGILFPVVGTIGIVGE